MPRSRAVLMCSPEENTIIYTAPALPESEPGVHVRIFPAVLTLSNRRRHHRNRRPNRLPIRSRCLWKQAAEMRWSGSCCNLPSREVTQQQGKEGFSFPYPFKLSAHARHITIKQKHRHNHFIATLEDRSGDYRFKYRASFLLRSMLFPNRHGHRPHAGTRL